ncbi:hypothetical protein BCR44DRAFT_1034130 [Catenaria anguillulae PL171]|uniref:Uncharacterized protein n=1 Tax=Catenaria anguillulae PL171 TaxID=765915 RepID=A0A1Y2HSC7_9FUNG|nr:hypothetical protein BCR44DRAFT_1034130 [Catenaria anguillulae PL171]
MTSIASCNVVSLHHRLPFFVVVVSPAHRFAFHLVEPAPADSGCLAGCDNLLGLTLLCLFFRIPCTALSFPSYSLSLLKIYTPNNAEIKMTSPFFSHGHCTQTARRAFAKPSKTRAPDNHRAAPHFALRADPYRRKWISLVQNRMQCTCLAE